jgi:two-component system, OmpR family, phosphate regulon sensor histidine kinase PhoR
MRSTPPKMRSPRAFTTNTLYTLVTLTLGVFASAFVRGSELDSIRKDKALQQTQLESDGLKTLINELADPIMSLDFRGRISLYNAAVLNLLDTNVSLAHKRIDDIITLETNDGKPLILASVFKSIRTVTIRDDIQTKIDGEIVRLEVTISPIKSHFTPTGERMPDGWIVIMRDITRIKSLEEERDEFISVVSHELRTPITIAEGAISNAQVILDSKEANRKTVNETVKIAHDQMVFLATMINDLSTLSRAERGVGDDGEDIDVDELVHALYAEYEPEASKRRLALNIHMPARIGHIHTSQLYLRELLQNFVINAIKYTHKGSITIDVTKSKSGAITFSVKDTGIGISKSDQKRIFEKFFRAEDYRTRETNGTGLGLYVAAKLSRKLGTEIKVKSRLNHGSTFSITLPASVSHAKSNHSTT